MEWGPSPGGSLMSTLKSPFRRRTTSNDGLERSVASTGTSSLGRQTKASSEDGAAIYRSLGTASSPRPKFSVRIIRTETATKGDTHTVYVLEVSYRTNLWVVKKRYSEFRSLHQHLERDFGRVALQRAQLPGKKMFGSLSHSVVEKRRQELQRYLNGLSENHTLWESSHTIRFLDGETQALGLQLSHHRLEEHVKRLEQKCALLEEECHESQSHVKFAYKMIENQDAMILDLRKQMEDLRALVRDHFPDDAETAGSSTGSQTSSVRVSSADSPPTLPTARVLPLDESRRLHGDTNDVRKHRSGMATTLCSQPHLRRHRPHLHRLLDLRWLLQTMGSISY